MKTHNVLEIKNFIGRNNEINRLHQFCKLDEAAIMVVYGRRRVGKTQLIEQTLGKRNLLKFEGLEKQPQADQIKQILYQLAIYTDEAHISKLNLETWVEALDFLADKIMQGTWTLYFEEVQWLANHENKFISALKFVWDNKLRHNPELKMILCGSSPSFMIKGVIQSKALYNRSLHSIHLGAFNLQETKEFLSEKSNKETIQAYLFVGGIPEYLKYLKKKSSAFLSMCESSFRENGFFHDEYEKIFISSLSDNIHYKTIIEFLSKKKYANREEIMGHLKIKSGGNLTKILDDLELCGFIEKYNPFQMQSGRGVYRYCIADPYLNFYNKFIKPNLEKIKSGQYNQNPTHTINQQSLQIWMGYAFERLIRSKKHLVAKILGFSGLPYSSGVYYNRSLFKEEPGYQIDLIFEHSQHVYTICEIKYYVDHVGVEVITEFEKKLKKFLNDKKHTIRKVLITNIGATEELIQNSYFDNILTIDDLFETQQY